MTSCADVAERYARTLGQQFECRGLEGENAAVLGTPYSYADGDLLDVLVICNGEELVLSDAGSVLSRLELHGLNPDSPTVQKHLRGIVRAFLVDLRDGQLEVEGPAGDSSEMLLRLVGAMREVDALRVLQPQPRPPRFEDRVLTHLKAHSTQVRDRPQLIGGSGTRYRLTAALGTEVPLYVQAVAGGRSESGVRSVNQAFRIFSDVNGELADNQKLVVLSSEDPGWRRGDLDLLSSVAYVAGWWHPTPMDRFLATRAAEDRLLFPVQTALS